jgi:hypothetical protein
MDVAFSAAQNGSTLSKSTLSSFKSIPNKVNPTKKPSNLQTGVSSFLSSTLPEKENSSSNSNNVSFLPSDAKLASFKPRFTPKDGKYFSSSFLILFSFLLFTASTVKTTGDKLAIRRETFKKSVDINRQHTIQQKRAF